MPSPPVAPRRPMVHREHDIERPDPWYGLRDRTDPEVIAYLEQENTWTSSRTSHLEGLRKTLFDEMLGRIQETDRSAPALADDGWWYARRTEAGRPYGIHVRSRDREFTTEHIVLDENVLAEGVEFLRVGSVDVSPDGSRMAYSVDLTGRERYTIRFRDLATGVDLPEVIEDAAVGITWANDNRTLFWRALDAAQRPFRVHRRTLGVLGDSQIYEETDDRFRCGTWRSRSGRFVFMQCSNSVSTELHLVPADHPESALRRVYARHPGLLARVEHWGDRLLFVTNDCDDADGRHTDGAVDHKLVEASVDSTGRDQWRDVVPHEQGVQRVAVLCFADHWVLTERENGQTRLRVRDVRTGSERILELPEAVHVVRTSSNLRYDTRTLRVSYGSMTTPPTVFDFDLDTAARVEVKRQPVPGYEPSRYRTTRLHATAPDGCSVPMSVVHRADLDLSVPQPTLLYGYGSYGMTVEPEFRSSRVSLLDRGVVYVIAHVRGGGFLGRSWYEAGKLAHKGNTFSDFVACAEHLVREGLTTPQLLAIQGGSAGGLLMGAVLNTAPDRFRCAVAQVPFVDVVTTMLDESLPLTAGEWDEWGDPRQREPFDTMLAYSPYDNVVEGVALPDLLVVSGLNDPRVQYWEPTKWVARLRDVTDTDVLLLTHMGAGHAGRSGRYGALEDQAFATAFVLDRLLGAAAQ